MWNLERTIGSQFKVTCKNADVFPVVASLVTFQVERSDDRKYICIPKLSLKVLRGKREVHVSQAKAWLCILLVSAYFLAFFLCRVPVLSVEVPCFFSLLREIFNNFSDSKANLQKVCSLYCTEIVLCALYIDYTTVNYHSLLKSKPLSLRLPVSVT